MPGSPIIIDLSGDGFQLTSAENGVWFDLIPGEQPERVAWTGAGVENAWLVLDRNGNGIIDDGTELFGNYTPQPSSIDPNGFHALAVSDRASAGGNEDGFISEDDSIYSQLRLWRDVNHDGISQPDELLALQDVGLEAISLGYRESGRVDQYGNAFKYRAHVGCGSDPEQRGEGS